MPPHQLPPLNSLRAFEAAAPHQSLSRAVVELNVTLTAVSRQVAKLEEFIRTKLLERKHQEVLLTKNGAVCAGRLQSLFEQIQHAIDDNFDARSDDNLLRIVVTKTFAMRLLVPRLVRVKKRFPDLKLQIDTYPSLPSHDCDADIEVWLGKGREPTMLCEHLFDEELVPVCSPSLLTEHTIRSADDLERFLLLHAQRRPRGWQTWMQVTGFTEGGLSQKHGRCRPLLHRLAQFNRRLQAACVLLKSGCDRAWVKRVGTNAVVGPSTSYSHC